jgi:pyruvate/2-oxoglutarate dehydrogenase complex dihydrolipoamide dehydrogenase (E3) component
MIYQACPGWLAGAKMPRGPLPGGCDRMEHREPAARGCRDGRAAAARRLRATGWSAVSQPRADVAIIGGGPGGYEAALVGAQLGARVTVVEADGLGGACVLTDCVPSKTLIATSETMGILAGSPGLGIRIAGYDGRMRPRPGVPAGPVTVDAARLNDRVKALALAQSADVAARLAAEGVEVTAGRGSLADAHTVVADGREISAGVVLLATGGMPRQLPGAEPDGERILNWRQLYDLAELPAELIVVGSGVTGAEFASAYQALGSQVTLISSRDRVLPNEDPDAAMVVEDVFRRRGMTVLSRSRAAGVKREGHGVAVTLADGRTVRGSHCLLTVGVVPATRDLGLDQAGVKVDDRGFAVVDKVSRTSAAGVYAAGDCTGILMLASVAAMQGRIAMWHALGEAVQPLRLSHVAATIFTEPEIATVGVSQAAVDSGQVEASTVKLPLATNARAKMQGFRDGFVKLFARPRTGAVIGGVVVAPRASELIFGISLAVEQMLTVDQIAHTFAVYPSLSGSLTEAARRLMRPGGEGA